MYDQTRRNSQTNSPQESTFSYGPSPSPVPRTRTQPNRSQSNSSPTLSTEPLRESFVDLLNQDYPPHIDLYSTPANRVIRGYSEQAEQGTSKWGRRIDIYKPYLEEPSDNNRERLKVKLEECENMLLRVMETVETEPGNFRGLIEQRGDLQAAATVKNQGTHLEVEELVTVPWNILQSDLESVKGAGTALMEELTKESVQLGFEGRLKLIAISSAVPFYHKIGLKETDEGYWELTPQAAKEFLEQQESRRHR